MPCRDHQVHLSIGSRFENIDLVQVVLEELLQQVRVDGDEREWIGMALREAVANAIKHGNRLDPEKQVEVELALAGEQMVIRVRDHGSGFDLESLEDPLAPENLLRPEGRGIFYMRKFMDEIDYRFHPEGGTEVTMRKRVAVPASGAGERQEEER